MESISHVLWAETIIRRPDLLLPIAVASNLPDFIGAMPSWISMGKTLARGLAKGGFSGVKNAYNNLPEPTNGEIIFYRSTHNLFAWGFFTVLLAIFAPRYLILSIAYLSHILVDIPTHGGVFGTRIFYPLSDWHVESVNWIKSGRIIAGNFILLILVNVLLYFFIRYSPII